MTMRALHKWLSIIIGIQILIWVASGLIISLLDHQIASGRASKQSPQPIMPVGAVTNLVPIDSLKLNSSKPIIRISLERAASNLIYRIVAHDGTQTFDAITGQKFSLSPEIAQTLALQSYKGDGQPTATSYRAKGSQEVHSAGAVWQVDFDDKLATSVYLSALDGSVVAHKNQYSAIVDFMLMLHFMDYARSHNFNNPQIIIISFLALWLSLSGLILVKSSFRRKDFAFIKRTK